MTTMLQELSPSQLRSVQGMSGEERLSLEGLAAHEGPDHVAGRFDSLMEELEFVRRF